MKKEYFGTTKDGQEVTALTLENSSGMKLRILDYGAIFQSIIVPDKNGNTVRSFAGRFRETDRCGFPHKQMGNR